MPGWRYEFIFHIFSPMENKQDRKLASLKKDPDEDVGSNHDRKPASLQKDPDEDVVTLNNHYDSTDMEEEDDYDELDELPLLDRFRMAEQYLREKNCSPRKRLEELRNKDKRRKKKVQRAKGKPKQQKLKKAFAKQEQQKNFQGYDLARCTITDKFSGPRRIVYLPPRYGWRTKRASRIPGLEPEGHNINCTQCNLTPCVWLEYCSEMIAYCDEIKSQYPNDEVLLDKVRSFLRDNLIKDCGVMYVNKIMPRNDLLPSCALEGTRMTVNQKDWDEECRKWDAKEEDDSSEQEFSMEDMPSPSY
jgi:hypothetical protein